MRQAASKLAVAAAALMLIGAGCTSTVATNVNVSPDVKVIPPVEQPAANVNADAGATSDMRLAGNAVIVGSQKPSKQLKVELVAIDKPGILLIREGNYANGVILGMSDLLTVGSNTNLSITLSRMSVDGETLYASVMADDGNGKFDSKDVPMVDHSGNPLYSSIEIDAKASEEPLLPRI